MKAMSLNKQNASNGGSVRCEYCGFTTWGVADCKLHTRLSHRTTRYRYTWYKRGPWGRYTQAWEHSGIIQRVR